MSAQIFEGLLRIHTAANLPGPLRSRAQQMLPSKVPIVATRRGATPSKAALQRP